MDLTNKQVAVTSMTVVTFPEHTTVTVTLSEQVVPGIYTVTGTYVLELDTMYYSMNDPALLNVINEKLALLP